MFVDNFLPSVAKIVQCISYSIQAVATSADEEEQRCREWMDGYLLTIREENEAKMRTLQDCHPNKKLRVAINCRVAVSKR